MKPQGVVLRRGTPVPPAVPRGAGILPAVASSLPNAPPFPWRLTRRLHSTGKLALYRASANTDRGPGCYILKTSRSTTIPGHFERTFLRREVSVTSAVKHTNLICVLAADHDAPRPYSLLPYQEGVALRCLLHQSAPAKNSSPSILPIARALNITRQIAEALAALHHSGWLHGQIRPEHVILSPQGHATLIDLTMARQLESSECESNDSFPISAQYAPPEISLARQRITPTADTYSLGIVLYEALTGQTPFTDSSPRQLLMRHRNEAPPDIRQFRSDISLEIAYLLRLMLAKDPLRRPTDSDLLHLLANLEIASLT